VSRLDAFFVHERGGLRFTEYNAETPAAAAYNDVLAEVTLGLPVMAEFLRRFEVRPQPSRQNVMHALLDSWHQWSGRRDRPRIAILDWRDVPTYSEFVITAEYLRSQGLDCTIADPRDVEYAGGALIAEGMKVDLIYKRVLISELIERGGLDHPVVRAVRERAVCMVNPFHCKILHKKASLAVLSDERNAELFSTRQREAIEAHIPWTRVVEERRTRVHGRDVDLLRYMVDNRESLVLKPNDEYGGTGIVLGWNCSREEWEEAVRTAIEEPFVVQERVAIPTEAYPSLVNGRVSIDDRILDTAPFIYYGSYMDGCLTRLSTDALVNVTAGGGSSLATFVVEPR
jgi:glutathionylspermidine synthase